LLVYRAKTPLRISFGGGSTDLEPYSSDHGGLTLSTTINIYAVGTLIPRNDDKIIIESLDFGVLVKYNTNEYIPLDGTLDLIKAVVNRVTPGKGFNLTIECSAPPGTGMGSSGSVAVLVIGLLYEYLGLNINKYEIAELAYDIEKNDLGIVVGRQDQYAAVFGGFNFIEYKKDNTIVNPLRLDPKMLNELETNLILCFMHQERSKEDPVNIEVEQYKKKQDKIIENFNILKQKTIEMKNNLLLGNLSKFIKTFSIEGQKKLERSILGKQKNIIKFIDCSISHNARAIKPLGASGGGYLLIISDYKNRKNLIGSLEKIGGTVMPVEFSKDGLLIWKTEY